MPAHVFFLQLALVLLAARLLGEVATLLRIPSVIGELAAGILLGPSLLGWVEPSELIRLLAEIGVILLLFEVGLDTDVSRLLHAGFQSTIVAIGGFVLPFVLGFGISHWTFDQPVLISMMIGGTLTATSIGITVRVLSDLGRRHTTEGQVILGAAVLDDVLGVILLALLYDFATRGEVSLANASRIALFVGLFFFLAPVAAKTISYLIRSFHARHDTPGLIPTTMVSLVLVFAALAHFVGAPELLGGFAAGLALSRRFFLPFGVALSADPAFADIIREEMKPIVRLFTPVFFVMVGLSLDLSAIDWTSSFMWFFSLSLLAVAIVGKFGGVMFIDEPPHVRIAIGMGMVPRGEVGLVFAELGRVTGILSNEAHAALVIVIAYTTLLAPFWIKWFYKVHRAEFEPSVPEMDHPDARLLHEEAAHRGHGA
jgi:Kef-type K+ transport system membrane component KefB